MSTPPEKLRFRARGTAMVQHIEKMYARTRSYVGRTAVLGKTGKAEFHPHDFVEEVPYRPEYVKECAEGNLWPADQATADACNVYAKAHGFPEVKLDPKHVGKTSQEHQADEEAKAAPQAANSPKTDLPAHADAPAPAPSSPTTDHEPAADHAEKG